MKTLFPKAILRSRIKRLQKILDHYPSSVACIGSSHRALRTRDSHHPYTQNNDFIYLTGSESLEDAVLLISSDNKKSFLIAPPTSKQKIVWEGPQEDPEELAEYLGVNFLESTSIISDAQKKIEGHSALVFQGEQFTVGAKIMQAIIERPVFSRGRLPSVFVHADKIIGELRLHKEQFEIDCIKNANLLAGDALYSVLPLLQPGVTEKEIVRAFEFSLSEEKSSPAFHTIVASGKNAATLHHTPNDTKLTKGSMVLFDVGATYLGYASDISRTFPVASTFSEIQARLYSAVLASQKAAIRTIKEGVNFRTVYLAAAKELSYALSEFKIVKKKPAEILKKDLFKPYFPHGIGHSLGLDVHDVGDLRSLGDVKLSSGMVLTVEPGLYMPKREAGIAPFGIRIEDDILVTKSGNQNLSVGFPKEIKDIESILA